MDKLINISELVVNAENPRKITEFMQGKLTQSILLSPWMHRLKPICIDDRCVIWSGNQRCASYRAIVSMDEDTIEDMLSQQTVYRDKTAEQQQGLVAFWMEWKKNPVVPCRTLDGWTDDEKKELLVRDNLHAGEDDPEILRKHFDRDLIADFFGSVSWDLYEYGDKINDQQLEANKNTLKKFKCGYVEFYLTDSEYEMLCRVAEEYKERHEGSLEGFLMSILDPDGTYAEEMQAEADAGTEDEEDVWNEGEKDDFELPM